MTAYLAGVQERLQAAEIDIVPSPGPDRRGTETEKDPAPDGGGNPDWRC